MTAFYCTDARTDFILTMSHPANELKEYMGRETYENFVSGKIVPFASGCAVLPDTFDKDALIKATKDMWTA